MSVHINIGSNIGASEALVAAAADRIRPLLPERPMRVSRPYRSLPWGFRSDNKFVNVGVVFDGIQSWTDDSLMEFFNSLRSVEKSLGSTPHRNADGSYCDRDLDIDLIDADGTVIDTPGLVLPHPRMHLRPFVLEPIRDLDPLWRHPVCGKTAAEMLLSIK